jgi:hypothetical protein
MVGGRSDDPGGGTSAATYPPSNTALACLLVGTVQACVAHGCPERCDAELTRRWSEAIAYAVATDPGYGGDEFVAAHPGATADLPPQPHGPPRCGSAGVAHVPSRHVRAARGPSGDPDATRSFVRCGLTDPQAVAVWIYEVNLPTPWLFEYLASELLSHCLEVVDSKTDEGVRPGVPGVLRQK